MSMMPEYYMALSSMGIGFSGLLSFLLYGILLVTIEDDEREFERVSIYYAICFVLMTIVSAMYFLERNNDFAQYFINLSN